MRRSLGQGLLHGPSTTAGTQGSPPSRVPRLEFKALRSPS